MRTLFLITYLALFVPSTGFSQDIVRLNLNQCIDTALKNNPDVLRKGIQYESSRINWQQQRANLLPVVNGGVTHGLNQGRSIDPLTNTYVTDQVFYASPYIGGSLLLFNGLALQNIIKQYSFVYQAAKQEEQQAKNDLVLNVILAYLQVLTNQDLYGLAITQQQTTVEQLVRLETLNKNGNIAPGEYFDLKGQYANDQLFAINSANSLENSKVLLVRLLNIVYNKNLLLAPLSTEQFLLPYEISPEEVYQTALQNFASVKAADLRKQSADMEVRSSRSAFFPSIYFNTALASNFSNAARDVQNQRIGYFNQFDNNLSKSYNISISIPLFNSFKTKNRVSLARLNQRDNEIIAQSTRTQLQQLTEQAYFNMTASENRYKRLKEQVEAYSESFRTVEIRFNAGVVNSVDYLIAKNNLDRANANLLSNRYDFILRKKILDFYQVKPLNL
ncbi:MAG: TolC family protein [Flavobacterium sp.]|nr:TolC family protein [Pedobacter sp.]